MIALRAPFEAELSRVLSMMEDFNRHEAIEWNKQDGEAPLRHLLAHSELGFFAVALAGEEIVG
jgi:hypothetical protein